MSRTINLPDSMADALSETLKRELEQLVNRTAEIRKVLGELQSNSTTTTTTASSLEPAKRPYTRRAPSKSKNAKNTKALSFTRRPGDPTITDTIIGIVKSSRYPMSTSQVCTEFNKLKGFKKKLSTRHASSVSAILYQQTQPNKPLTREQQDGTWFYRFTDGKPSVTSKVETTDAFPDYKGPRNQAGQPGPNHFIN